MTLNCQASRTAAPAKSSTDPQSGHRQARRIESPASSSLSSLGDRLNGSPAATRLQTLQRAMSGSPAAASGQSNGGLPAQLRSGIEQLSGLPMDGVRVHLNSSRPAQLQAHAFTQGTDIHVAPGQERHLPHEAWHVVQQMQGRVGATRQLAGGTPLNDDKGLEQEADTMGARAVQLRATPADGGRATAGVTARTGSLTVQRKTTYEQQTQALADIDYILEHTQPNRVTALSNRITFNANPKADQAAALQFPHYRTRAEAILAEFRNVFAENKETGGTSYQEDGLDLPATEMREARTKIADVMDNNTPAMVASRKKAMMKAVAIPILHQKIEDKGKGEFRDAKTLADAETALKNWEATYFMIDRSQVMKTAKKDAKNGKDNATVWSGISGPVGHHATHMTVYNRDVKKFDDYFVTGATSRADSDLLANNVMPNQSDDRGVHITAEVNPAGNVNPRLFGNPPAIGRYYNNLATIDPKDLVRELGKAQDKVRLIVWDSLILPRKRERP